MKRIKILILATVFLAACGGSSTTKATYGSSKELLTALTSANLPCTGYKATDKADREWGQESAKEVGTCELDGETVDVTIWKDSGQRKNWEGMGKSIGCTMGESFGISEFDYLNGGTWTISNTSKTLTEKLASEIGGAAVHIEC
jgi:hypothetical protein